MKKIYFDGILCNPLEYKDIRFLSLAFVKENGEHTYFHINQDPIYYYYSWRNENIISELKKCSIIFDHTIEGVSAILSFVGKDNENSYQLIGDNTPLKWVGLLQMFNRFKKSPPFYYIPVDISTLIADQGIGIDIDREKLINSLHLRYAIESPKKHNALYNARAIKKIYETIRRS